ncbi:MAG: Gfo/Idh/MocA family protein [Steroidobacteraceae bacterium]
MSDPSRRRFMLQTASAAAAPFVSAAGSRALARGSRALAQGSRRKIGIALCGLGQLSRDQIAPAIAKTVHCRLAGLITGSAQKARDWQAQYGIPARSIYTYDTMARMADNPDIDVVYIVTPNAEHLEQTVRAAGAGKHVFCEKPMAVSVEAGQRMIAACAAAKRLLGIAYRCQYDPDHLECIRIARSGEFGPIRTIDAGFGIQVGPAGQWRLKRRLSGGGALVDVGIYALQATRYLTGAEPIEVSAFESKTDPKKFAEVDEQMSWLARFPGGIVAKCAASYNLSGLNAFRVYAERGWFGLDPAFAYGGNRGERSDGKAIALPEPDLFAAEMDDFARCILDGGPSKVSGEEGLKDLRIMTAIYESARSGRAVTVA